MIAAHTSQAAVPVLRSGRVKRETKETKVDVTISIDGTGRCKAQTPIHFLNHMLDVSAVFSLSTSQCGCGSVCQAITCVYSRCSTLQQIASHGLFDLNIEAEGDTWIDDHHTNEDLGTLLKHLGVCSDICMHGLSWHNISCLCSAALAFGGALSQALGDRKGIHRFGDFSAPLDEALVHVVLVSAIHWWF